jgi:peptidoglycan-N-acetylglucosamine deacetylase
MSRLPIVAAAVAGASIHALIQVGAAQAQSCPGRPDALGTSRVLAVDASQFSHVGTLQYKETLPLADKEVVLTFDDGPLPPYSNEILDVLTAQCVKATFFIVGAMAKAFPEMVRREYEAGYTIGTHSESHPLHFGRLSSDRLAEEIDGGIAAVSAAIGDPSAVAPFFRIPGLERSDAVEAALAARSLTVFSVDVVADDWHRNISPAKIIKRAMTRLEKHGSGILLLHDIHPWTVAALPGLLKELKERGFHIVQVVPAVAATAANPAVAGAPMARRWPQPNRVVASADALLPVPDAAGFAINDAEESGSVETAGGTADWPNVSEGRIAHAAAELTAPSPQAVGISLPERKLVGHDLGPWSNLDVGKPVAHARLRHGPFHAHRRARLHERGERHRAALQPGLRAIAALPAPAH